MGYSISMSAKSPKAYNEMVAFLEEHFRPASEFIDVDMTYDVTADGPLPGKHLGYDEGSTKLGFNYSAVGNGSRYYAYCLCRWMALKVGRNLRSEAVGDHDVPYIRYDGHKSIPVLVRSKWEGVLDAEDLGTRYCDKWGIKPHHEAGFMRERFAAYKVNPEDAVPGANLYNTTVDKFIGMIQDKIDRLVGLETTVRKEIQRLDELWDERNT